MGSSLRHRGSGLQHTEDMEPSDKLFYFIISLQLKLQKNLLKENSSNVDESETLNTASSGGPKSSNETKSLIYL